MTEKNNIQNMVFQQGQSQENRKARELDVHFADVEERSTEDLLLYAKRLAAFINYYADKVDAPAGAWSSFFPFDEKTIAETLAAAENGETPPHLALFLAFLELYTIPRERINRLTGVHLDFYFRRVLGFTKRPSVADKAHVILELKKNAAPIAIGPDNVFSAGKDKTKAELLYAPTATSIITNVRVASLRSLFVEPGGKGTVRYAPVANSADGVGGPLDEANPRWPGFGGAFLPTAEIGFALAAPVLRLREGLRKITVELTITNVNAAKITKTALANIFEVFVTGEKGWLGPFVVSPTLDSGRLTFEFTVAETEKGIVDYDRALHGYAYTAAAPVLQALLRQDTAAAGYRDLKSIRLTHAALSVEVTGITSLTLANDGGSLDPQKAFLPFGPQPTVGSRFMVEYTEALAKRLTNLDLTLTWKAPPANFATHYQGYGVTPSVSENSFTASISFRDGSGRQEEKTLNRLFATNPITMTFTTKDLPGSAQKTAKGKQMQALGAEGSSWAKRRAESFGRAQPVYTSGKPDASKPRAGAITLTLEHDFLHAAYRKKHVENLVMFAKNGGTLTVLNEPYTPTVQAITLGYAATSGKVPVAATSLGDFANSDCHFHHITYFGQMREHGYQRAQFSFLTDKTVGLLPRHEAQGELLLGLGGVTGGDSAHLLFQVAQGSADPSLSRQSIIWSVLSDNYWMPLAPGDLSRDTTDGLFASGIISLVIPTAATTTNTILPSGLIWLKAAIDQNVHAVCELIEVAANAIEVRFMDKGNDPEHLAVPLEKGSITKFKAPVAAVKSVKQPFSSFGGVAAEPDANFHTRVAERLRHKNRAITLWDYERLILDAFPGVHKVKCIPHAKEGCWLAPGHVLIVVIPDLRNTFAMNPLEPRVDAGTIKRIEEFITKRTGMGARVTVKNPAYQKIQAEFKVRFREGLPFNYYQKLLEEELLRALSPWAYDTGRDLAFGGRVYQSVLLDRVEELDYVDYVTEFKLFSFTGEARDPGNVPAIEPSAPDAILVSAKNHVIGEA